MTETELVAKAVAEVGRTFGPYLSLINAGILFLIWLRMASAMQSLEGLVRTISRLEHTLDRTLETVGRHAQAIARLEGWLERHNHNAE